MFSNKQDTDSIKAARKLEKQHISKWIDEVWKRNKEIQKKLEPGDEPQEELLPIKPNLKTIF